MNTLGGGPSGRAWIRLMAVGWAGMVVSTAWAADPVLTAHLTVSNVQFTTAALDGNIGGPLQADVSLYSANTTLPWVPSGFQLATWLGGNNSDTGADFQFQPVPGSTWATSTSSASLPNDAGHVQITSTGASASLNISTSDMQAAVARSSITDGVNLGVAGGYLDSGNQGLAITLSPHTSFTFSGSLSYDYAWNTSLLAQELAAALPAGSQGELSADLNIGMLVNSSDAGGATPDAQWQEPMDLHSESVDVIIGSGGGQTDPLSGAQADQPFAVTVRNDTDNVSTGYLAMSFGIVQFAAVVNLTSSPVPEPANGWMMAWGLAGLGILMIRKMTLRVDPHLRVEASG